MGNLFESPEFSDVLNDSYITGTVTATTSQIELKVGGSPLVGRELLIIHNNGSKDIWIGPSGVTTSNGIPVEDGETITISVGQNLSVYAITSSGTASVVVQELG